jgi:hypothetical protein
MSLNPSSRTYRDRWPTLLPSVAWMVAIVLPCSGPMPSRSREAAREPAGQKPPEQPSNATDCHKKPRPPVRSVPRGEPPRRSPAHKTPRRQPGPLQEKKKKSEGREQQMSDKKKATSALPSLSPALLPAASTSSAGREKALGRLTGRSPHRPPSSAVRWASTHTRAAMLTPSCLPMELAAVLFARRALCFSPGM